MIETPTQQAAQDDPGYVIDALPDVTIAGRTFRAEHQHGPAMHGEGTFWLTGARGGVFFLRPFLGEQTGVHQVISWRSGAPLRDRCGREVRVLWLGNIIEDITVKPRPIH